MLTAFVPRSWLARLAALAAAALAVAAGSVPSAGAADGGRILVYVGNAALSEGYTRFGQAAGKPVDTLPVLPADLSPYDCIVLPINSIPFNSGQKAQLSAYANSGGGIVGLAEHSGFAGSITTMNDLAAALGAGLQVIPAVHDGGFHTTTNIDPSTWTTGVDSIRYAATSEVQVQVSGGAESLVRTQSLGRTFIGIDKLGSGFLLLSGDSNAFSDNSETGYLLHDNGVLVANLCGERRPGPPFTLVLDPLAATNPVDSQHCVTATVRDEGGRPVPGVTVRFSVTGSVSASGAASTNSDGEAKFCYTGPPLPGADRIHAYADTNGNNVQDAPPPAGNEPFGDATKTWVLPVSTPGCEIKITNGGWIVATNGDRASFGGNAKVDADGNVSGQEQYQDHGPATPFNLHGNVLVVVCNPDGISATIFGQATIDGSGSHTYRIDVRDVAEPGRGADRYRMRVNAYDSGDQVLQGGNVQVHRG